MLIESFEVKNFRSLKHLKLEKLARVNLLVGKNNSGKTSVLEGLFLFTGYDVFSWIDHIDGERRLSGNGQGFDYLFYQFSPENSITLKSHIKPGNHSQYSTPPYDIEVIIQPLPLERTVNQLLLPGLLETEDLYRSGGVPKQAINRLRFTADSTENSSAPSGVFYTTQQRWTGLNERLATKRNALAQLALGHWLGTTTSFPNLYARIEYLKVKKQDARLVKIMQQIDPRINDIVLGSEHSIYLNLGVDFTNLLPLNLMGDGVQHLLDISAAMAHTPGAVIQIDEIDNGLHYSTLRILWKGILQAAREFDVQVFVTTHSAEALRNLTWVLDDEENASYRDEVAAYTLIRAKDDTVSSFRYDASQLEFALEHDIEIRN
ncbi:MAG TPA: AAA family ATPase [Hymenobacter sp.]|jgi:hypothetical protein|uniref:AAA family ATPase n=1 Tax=Hymenobacter sp. TaxID=1898978 RepID=UPI002EDA4618